MNRRTFVALAFISPAAASRIASAALATAEGAATPVAALSPVALEFLWASTGGPDPFSSPYGIGIAPDGNVWVADGFNGRFQILAPDGSFIETWGAPGAGEGEFNFETLFGGTPHGYGDVAWDAAGNIYVADVGNRRVQKFGPDRAFLLD